MEHFTRLGQTDSSERIMSEKKGLNWMEVVIWKIPPDYPLHSNGSHRASPGAQDVGLSYVSAKEIEQGTNQAKILAFVSLHSSGARQTIN